MPSAALISGSIRDLPREHVLTQIIEGAFRPGLIISPTALSADLGLSPTPVREALIELVRDGFLESLPRRGFAVRALTSREAAELCSLCWTLERFAVESALPSEATLDRLDWLNDELLQAKSPLEIHKLDSRWHETLVSENRSTTLHEILGILRARLRRYEVAYFRQGGALPTSVDQHAAISLALRNHELESALEHLRANWLVSLPLLSTWLDGQADKPSGKTE